MALAPQAVLNALSQDTRDFLNQRKNGNTLSPYINIKPNLRIRGLKPSLLYTTYTVLDNNNILEPLYEVKAEESQTTWIKNITRQINNENDRYLLNEKAQQEAPWIQWEDAFMAGSESQPLQYPQFYIDLTGNTHLHILAHAIVNRTHIDIGLYNEHFVDAHFTTSNQMYIQNKRYQTPLSILMDNSYLYEFVESLLLRLSPESRLVALPFNYWQSSWGRLINTMMNNHIQIIVLYSITNQGFTLSKFLDLTFQSKEALMQLFQAGYRLSIKHFRLSEIARIAPIIEEIPTWHNATIMLYSMSRLMNKNDTTYFKKYQQLLKKRGAIIFDELMSIVLHPDRIKRLIELGYKSQDLHNIT